MKSVDLMSLWAFVCSVLLCSSVRKKTLENCRGEFFLSQRTFFSLTERTEFTEQFCAQFRVHRRPSAYRVHRALLLKMGVMYVKEESKYGDKKILHRSELNVL